MEPTDRRTPLQVVKMLLWGFLTLTAATSLAQGDTWTTKTPMPTARLGLAACEMEGKIYAIGGYPRANVFGLTTVEAYDPSTDAWEVRQPMPTARRWLACGTLGNRIYAIGGFPTIGQPALRTVEVYDPATDSWTKAADMVTARKGLSVAVLDGSIYAIGGADDNGQLLASIEVYDPTTDSWSLRAPMQAGRAMLASAAVDGKIYAIGGPAPGTTAITAVEEYDPVLNAWTSMLDMPTGRWALTATAVGGLIYAIGGASSPRAIADVEVYDPSENQWTAARGISAVDEPRDGGRWAHAASEVDGKIYVIGGALDPAMPPHPSVSRVQEYTPMLATKIEEVPDGKDHTGQPGFIHNYPNPFSLSTHIRFDLPRPQPVRLVLFDALGRFVSVLAERPLNAGIHSIRFSAGDLPAGRYFYRLETSAGNATGAMQLAN